MLFLWEGGGNYRAPVGSLFVLCLCKGGGNYRRFSVTPRAPNQDSQNGAPASSGIDAQAATPPRPAQSVSESPDVVEEFESPLGVQERVFRIIRRV